MSDIPQMQSAWRIHRAGAPRDPGVLSLDQVPVPKPLKGQALVKVEAAALNPVMHKLVFRLPWPLIKRPKIVESDFTGTVVDANGTNFKNGDRVFGALELNDNANGALAQYVAVDENHAGVVPDRLTVEQAAGLAVVGATIIEAGDRGGILTGPDGGSVDGTGKHVLVTAGSSSVGTSMIQLLKSLGYTTHTSCSTANVEFVKSLGAEVVYDYKKAPVLEQLKTTPPPVKFSAIIDIVGEVDLYSHSNEYLDPKGNFVVIGTPVHGAKDVPGYVLSSNFAKRRPTWLGGPAVKRQSFLASASKITVDRLRAATEKGWMTPVVDSTYEFSDLLSAYDRIMTGRAKGKVVIRVP
ncbi:NAD(P)-binding protein [Clavulina sp. PMI_390]|nr:NAD(P)-binding protein [Clavulina sp. PMI_390]